MRQLMRVYEGGGHMLNPFAGYGTTLVAADLEGYGWTRIEMTGHYYGIATGRLTEGGNLGWSNVNCALAHFIP
jgi:site-specific DNA-methyltransferase (adenine-specific)